MKIAVLFKEENKQGFSANKKGQELFGNIKKYLASKSIGLVPPEQADFIVTLGGDGTLIHTACKYADLNIPFLGINSGNLGFLTAVEAEDWKKATDNLISGKIFISERITLEARVLKRHPRGVQSNDDAHPGGEPGYLFRAVNEVVIKSQFRVVNLEIKVSGEDFLKVTGDGVIIATQTGSTAYSLSAGGSIVDSDLNCLVVTPINPIGLPIPSVVLSPSERIEVNVVGGGDVSLILDGQEHSKLGPNSKVVISSSPDKVKFVYFDKKHFLKSLNAKFGLASRTTRK